MLARNGLSPRPLEQGNLATVIGRVLDRSKQHEEHVIVFAGRGFDELRFLKRRNGFDQVIVTAA